MAKNAPESLENVVQIWTGLPIHDGYALRFKCIFHEASCSWISAMDHQRNESYFLPDSKNPADIHILERSHKELCETLREVSTLRYDVPFENDKYHNTPIP